MQTKLIGITLPQHSSMALPLLLVKKELSLEGRINTLKKWIQIQEHLEKTFEKNDYGVLTYTEQDVLRFQTATKSGAANIQEVEQRVVQLSRILQLQTQRQASEEKKIAALLWLLMKEKFLGLVDENKIVTPNVLNEVEKIMQVIHPTPLSSNQVMSKPENIILSFDDRLQLVKELIAFIVALVYEKESATVSLGGDLILRVIGRNENKVRDTKWLKTLKNTQKELVAVKVKLDKAAAKAAKKNNRLDKKTKTKQEKGAVSITANALFDYRSPVAVNKLEIAVGECGIHSSCFSPSGNRIVGRANVGNGRREVRIIQLKNQAITHVKEVNSHDQFFTHPRSTVYSQKQDIIAIGDCEPSITMVDVSKAKLKVMESSNTHNDDIHILRFSPDGRVLAAAANDYAISFQDVASGEHLYSTKGESNVTVDQLIFSRDSRYLIAVKSGLSKPKSFLQVIDVLSGNVINGIIDKDRIIHVDVRDNNKELVFINGKGVVYTSLLTANSKQTYMDKYTLDSPEDNRNCKVQYLKELPVKNVIAYNGNFSGIRLYNFKSKESKFILAGSQDAPESKVLDFEVCPEGQYLAAVSEVGIIRITDLASGLVVFSSDSDDRFIDKKMDSIAFSPNGRFLVASGLKGSVVIEFDAWK